MECRYIELCDRIPVQACSRLIPSIQLYIRRQHSDSGETEGAREECTDRRANGRLFPVEQWTTATNGSTFNHCVPIILLACSGQRNLPDHRHLDTLIV